MAFHRYFLKITIFAILISVALYAQAQDPDFGVFPSGTLSNILIYIANFVGRLGIPVAAFFIIWTGFTFVTAGGSEEKLKTARLMLVWTLIGTAIILGAPVIARMIINFAESIGAAP